MSQFHFCREKAACLGHLFHLKGEKGQWSRRNAKTAVVRMTRLYVEKENRMKLLLDRKKLPTLDIDTFSPELRLYFVGVEICTRWNGEPELLDSITTSMKYLNRSGSEVFNKCMDIETKYTLRAFVEA